MTGMDAFAPAEIASLVESRGVAKANAPFVATFVLGVLAGAFIALGGVLSTVISTGSELGFGITRWLSGIGFSLGLVLVIVAGAELFTGNNLIVMSVVSGKLPLTRLLRNWAIVYVGNLVGALSIAVFVWLADWASQDDGAVGATALSIAVTKASLPFWDTLWRGVLANALVCLAVWLSTGGRTLIDKVVAIVFPISAFVAAAGGVAMVHAVEVAASARRRGIGARLMATAARWAAEAGAERLALAVTRENVAARALYDALGMTQVASYHYRVAPG